MCVHGFFGLCRHRTSDALFLTAGKPYGNWVSQLMRQRRIDQRIFEPDLTTRNISG
ncbi:hypothetical protein BD293_4604 [Roseinatronobacter monicus]|uniref:Uncharacterized protein n=1 Tax=Roseinatronobacter monicus TaxID=393481 RepID=A0A543K3C5_9RHOB|nr:hypothetical protein BD293_4604 [Roseinatronobacter monicus]